MVGKVALLAATLVCLASLGGAMLLAWWLLVPLHWLAARNAGPVETAGWGVLAGLSLAEVATLSLYVVSGDGVHLAVVFVGVLAATAVAFIRKRSAAVATSGVD